jgi:branched-chain amino acid transport system substrate-binding protein
LTDQARIIDPIVRRDQWSKTLPKQFISRRSLTAVVFLATVIAASAGHAADGKLTIGVVLPLSGAFANEGEQYQNGIKVYQALHGNKAGNLTVDVVTRDDQGPSSGDLSRRLTQELIVRDKADVILGYSFTPNAMSSATLLTEAKKPAVIINAATSVITERSPYFVRVSFTLPQLAATLGTWAAKNNIKTAFTIVSDYAPGIDAETWFKNAFTDGGGKVIGGVRTGIADMEYAPYLQRATEAKPDAIFVFNPGGDVAVAFMKEAEKRGIQKSGIKLIVTGDVVEDQSVPLFGDAIEGVVSVHHYQVGLANPENSAFVKKYKELFGNKAIPNFRAVQGYDGMGLIHKAVEKTGGKLDADALMAAFKGMTIQSPRGHLTIDPDTRDVVQDMYIRRGAKKDGEWQNVEFETVKDVKDPAKAAKK